MGRIVEYYDYRETVGEMLFRNLEKVMSIVVVTFVFSVLVFVQHGNMEIEKLEWDLRMTQITNSIQRSIRTEKPITIERAVFEAVETEEITVEETEEVTETKQEVVETTEAVKASMTVLSEEEITMAKAINYNPTPEGREMLCKVVFAEAGIEGFYGQVLVGNVAYNNMIANGKSDLIQELKEGRYTCIVNGQVYNEGKIVEFSDIPQSVKDAVDEALRNDYTEEILKAEAQRLGIEDSKYWEGGATYFCTPGCAGRENVKVRFQLGGHMFYRYWDE